MNDKFCGLVKCDIECPKDMYVPILPSKNDRNSLVFDLLDKSRQTFASPELKYAIEEGYKITKIYNVYSYEGRTGIFKDYVEFFYKMKIENTQFYTPEECEEINKGFQSKGLNIEIKSENTSDNPGLRGVAKLFLNSLWGKFGQRDIMTEYTYVRSKKELIKYTTNPDICIVNTHGIHENLMEVHYIRNGETTDPPDYVSPITAVFTTSNARVRLAKFMRVLHPDQLFYCDTDSCYFRYDPDNPTHIDPRTTDLPEKVEIGNGIGQWEMELSDGKRWCATGAKSYATECKNEKNNIMKTKGLTLDYNNKDTITFDALSEVAQSINKVPKEDQQILYNKDQLKENNIKHIKSVPRFRFDYDKNTKNITTYDTDKIIQNTVGLKRWVENNVSYPYGYEGIHYTM